MKCTILFFALINFVYLVLSSGDLDRCSRECEIILTCVYMNDGDTSSIPIWPLLNSKKPDVTKCYCESVDQYKKCIDCYYAFNLPKKPSSAQIDSQCKAMENKSKTTTTVATTTVKSIVTTTKAVVTTVNEQQMTTTSITLAAPTLTPSSIPNAQESDNKEIDNKGSANENKKGKSNIIIYSVIGCIVVVGVIGFFVYNNKKSRPESMPFFGNSVSSPSQFATLDVPKNNITMSYNNNSYNPSPYNTLRGSNDPYYTQSNYNYGQTSTYENQYGQYQTMDYQYPPPYDNNVSNVGTTVNTVASTVAAAANATTTTAVAATATTTSATVGMEADQTNNENNENSISYDVRRESMNQSMNQSINHSSSSLSPSPVGNTSNNQTNNQTYDCTYPYKPMLNDELELRLNDKVQILEEFEDGWMKAINLTSGMEGMAPMVCVKGPKI